MKAIEMLAYGGPDVLKLKDVPRPEAGAGEVLVRVCAAGVNPVDWKIREGYFKERLDRPLPIIPGSDFAGVVEGVGAGVTLWKVGDEVFGRAPWTRDGAYAEYLAVSESEIALKPESIDFVHAAAMPIAALTAWQALFDEAELQPHQTVLIHAAAGGVGSFAVQLAKWKGARVIGTCSAANAQFVRDLGADQVIDYTTQRFERLVRDADVVLDTIGKDTQERSWRVLRHGGILVSIVQPPNLEHAAAHGVRGEWLLVQTNAGQLAELARLVDEGKLRVYVEKILPLAEASAAQKLSQSGHARGKIVLTAG